MQSIIRIGIPYHLTENTFNNEVQKELFYAIQKRTQTVIFNFSRTTFVSSYAMMLFIVLCYKLIYEENKKIAIILSQDLPDSKEGSCVSILTRLGFFDSLPKAVTYFPEKPERFKHLIGSNTGILELTKFRTKNKGLELIDLAEQAILNNTDYEEEHVQDICVMISELMQNIFIHSETKRASLISIQRYPKINLLQLAIADAGIGIPTTLRRAKKYKSINDDFLFIYQALKQRSSQFEDTQQRGEGLVRCRFLAKKHKACLYIRSNSGFIKVDFSNKPDIYGNDTYELPGTQIYINFPMHRI